MKGQRKMENDSVHATIERVSYTSRHLYVYTTPHWAGIISVAKQSSPKCLVKEPDKSQFYDFKQIALKLKFFYLDEDRQKVKWLNIKSMKLTSENPGMVHILHDFDGE